jgi:hypothetical protein
LKRLPHSGLAVSYVAAIMIGVEEALCRLFRALCGGAPRFMTELASEPEGMEGV